MINEVKYVEMNSAWKSIQDSADKIGAMIYSLSGWTRDLRNVWSGKLFNEFLEIWNSNVEILRGHAITLETKLPGYLNQVIKNYALYDLNDSVVVAEVREAGKGQEIEEVKLTDETEESLPNVEEMEKIFGDMVEGFGMLGAFILELESKVNSLPWDSDSHTEFVTRFNTISTNAKNYIIELQNKMCGKLQSVIENAKAVNAANSETVV